MDASVRATCPECGASITILPPKVYSALGAEFSSLEDQLAFLEHITRQTTSTGDRVCIADVNGAWTCPVCSHRDRVDDERKE